MKLGFHVQSLQLGGCLLFCYYYRVLPQASGAFYSHFRIAVANTQNQFGVDEIDETSGNYEGTVGCFAGSS